MRCKIGDMVLVITGPAAGTIGNISFQSRVPSFDWIVHFNKPVDAWYVHNPKILGRGTDVNCKDSSLIPLRPGKAPEEVDEGLDIGAVV